MSALLLDECQRYVFSYQLGGLSSKHSSVFSAGGNCPLHLDSHRLYHRNQAAGLSDFCTGSMRHPGLLSCMVCQASKFALYICFEHDDQTSDTCPEQPQDT